MHNTDPILMISADKWSFFCYSYWYDNKIRSIYQSQ